jgi:hypothetical protein
MNRRRFFERFGIGSASLAAGAALGTLSIRDVLAQNQDHAHEQVDGPLASATVSFGQWRTDPPTNRFPNVSPRAANQHLLIPYMPTIKAGGSVNFVIAGTHQVLVYEPGTQTRDISIAVTVPFTNNPSGNPDLKLIDDPVNRVYRGLDPSLQPPDRVEVVTFAGRGTYLVICGFFPHFVTDNMHGFVRVV